MNKCRKDSTGLYHLGPCHGSCMSNIIYGNVELTEEERNAETGFIRVTTLVPETGAKKYDFNKPQMDLLSPIALNEIAKVLTFGAKKYDAHNWRKGIIFSRLLGACLRHVFSYLGGESKDPESGLSHLAHASCCLMFLLEFEVTRPDLDDRYKSEATHQVPAQCEQRK